MKISRVFSARISWLIYERIISMQRKCVFFVTSAVGCGIWNCDSGHNSLVLVPVPFTVAFNYRAVQTVYLLTILGMFW